MISRVGIISSILLLVLDVIWIRVYMGKQYANQINLIQGSPMRPNILFAVFAYVLMFVGLNMFVLPRIRVGSELLDSIRYGFTFGIILYGVYDFISAAVFKDWDTKLAFIDILWGGFVYFIASYIGSKIGRL